MSGVFKGIKKVFKKVKKAVKSVAKGIGKAVKKVFKSKIFRAVLIAAAIWFTAGTATAFLANPSAGFLSAMQTSAGNMWTTATSFLSGSTAAAGQAAGTAATGATTGATAAATEAAATGTLNVAAGTTAAAAEAGATAAGAAGSAAGTAATAGTATSGGGIVSSALNAAKGVGNFIEANPKTSLLAFSGASNAYKAAAEREAANKKRKYEEKLRNERGLYGQDVGGQGNDLPTESGLLTPYLRPEATGVQPAGGGQASMMAANATQAPVVQRPVKRQQLPELRRQGFINSTRV